MDNKDFSTPSQTRVISRDEGLRAHMNRVYNRMAGGVLVTALTAAYVAASPALLHFLLGGPQAFIVIFAPLAIVWFGFNPARMNSKQLMISFFAIAVLYGISFSVLGLIFTKESIARAFFIAAGMFAGLSIFGYTTKKNLDGLGAFCVMGIWGLLIASIFAMFFPSNAMLNMISVVGIIAFGGMTAWQTQALKEMYSPSAGDETNSRMAWAATLNLYIAFIALFQYILQLMGQHRR